MTLYMIGIGLHDEKDITIKGLEAVKKSEKVFLESYTSKINVSIKKLEQFFGKKISVADRTLVEQNSDEILRPEIDVAFLVIGDPMSATTHTDLMLRARKKGISVKVIHNASVMTAVGITGLELYKFGKTTSIVFPQENFRPETHYDVIKMNLANGLHTLCLLDIKSDEKRYMTINEALKNLLDIEAKRKEGIIQDNSTVIGCARLGAPDFMIKAGKLAEIMMFDFGKPLHCLIIPGKLHFIEEEAIEVWKDSRK